MRSSWLLELHVLATIAIWSAGGSKSPESRKRVPFSHALSPYHSKNSWPPPAAANNLTDRFPPESGTMVHGALEYGSSFGTQFQKPHSGGRQMLQKRKKKHNSDEMAKGKIIGINLQMIAGYMPTTMDDTGRVGHSAVGRSRAVRNKRKHQQQRKSGRWRARNANFPNQTFVPETEPQALQAFQSLNASHSSLSKLQVFNIDPISDVRFFSPKNTAAISSRIPKSTATATLASAFADTEGTSDDDDSQLYAFNYHTSAEQLPTSKNRLPTDRPEGIGGQKEVNNFVNKREHEWLPLAVVDDNAFMQSIMLNETFLWPKMNYNFSGSNEDATTDNPDSGSFSVNETDNLTSQIVESEADQLISTSPSADSTTLTKPASTALSDVGFGSIDVPIMPITEAVMTTAADSDQMPESEMYLSSSTAAFDSRLIFTTEPELSTVQTTPSSTVGDILEAWDNSSSITTSPADETTISRHLLTELSQETVRRRDDSARKHHQPTAASKTELFKQHGSTTFNTRKIGGIPQNLKNEDLLDESENKNHPHLLRPKLVESVMSEANLSNDDDGDDRFERRKSDNLKNLTPQLMSLHDQESARHDRNRPTKTVNTKRGENTRWAQNEDATNEIDVSFPSFAEQSEVEVQPTVAAELIKDDQPEIAAAPANGQFEMPFFRSEISVVHSGRPNDSDRLLSDNFADAMQTTLGFNPISSSVETVEPSNDRQDSIVERQEMKPIKSFDLDRSDYVKVDQETEPHTEEVRPIHIDHRHNMNELNQNRNDDRQIVDSSKMDQVARGRAKMIARNGASNEDSDFVTQPRIQSRPNSRGMARGQLRPRPVQTDEKNIDEDEETVGRKRRPTEDPRITVPQTKRISKVEERNRVPEHLRVKSPNNRGKVDEDITTARNEDDEEGNGRPRPGNVDRHNKLPESAEDLNENEDEDGRKSKQQRQPDEDDEEGDAPAPEQQPAPNFHQMIPNFNDWISGLPIQPPFQFMSPPMSGAHRKFRPDFVSHPERTQPENDGNGDDDGEGDNDEDGANGNDGGHRRRPQQHQEEMGDGGGDDDNTGDVDQFRPRSHRPVGRHPRPQPPEHSSETNDDGRQRSVHFRPDPRRQPPRHFSHRQRPNERERQ